MKPETRYLAPVHRNNSNETSFPSPHRPAPLADAHLPLEHRAGWDSFPQPEPWAVVITGTLTLAAAAAGTIALLFCL
jgi:hypothetical protein